MSSAFKAGLIYFAGVFALGFLLGGIRLMLLLPLLGELLAVVIEVPIMLLFCWLLSARAVKRFAVKPHWRDRAVMGMAAFVCLILAEFALSVAMFGNSTADYLRDLATVPGAIGFAGQIAFATFPLVQLQLENRDEES